MTMKPVIDCSTGEIIEVPLTEEEIAFRETVAEEEEQREVLRQQALAAQQVADLALVGVLNELAQAGSTSAIQTIQALQEKAAIEAQLGD